MIDDLRLVVGDRAIEGWQSIRVTRGIERCPSDFSVGMTERYPGEADVATVNPGDACKVMLGGDLVVTGYVDRFMPSITPNSHNVTVSGRGKCQDLVDCSAQWPGNQFSNATILTIAQQLAKFYGISVSAQHPPPDVLRQININRGETSFEIIERICRYTSLLCYEGTDGNLILSNVGTQKHASGFKQGVNIEQASALFSMDQQFSRYDLFGKSFNTLRDVGDAGFLLNYALNPNVTRPRIKDLMQYDGDSVLVKKRPIWESNRRIARSYMLHVTTDSWRDSSGALYEPNKLIDVDVPALKIPNRTWLIGEVTYRRDGRGTACDLTIMPPDAFAPEPINLFPTLKEISGTPPSNARPN